MPEVPEVGVVAVVGVVGVVAVLARHCGIVVYMAFSHEVLAIKHTAFIAVDI